MRYLILTAIQAPFLTNWFEVENNWTPEIGMQVFDLVKRVYMIDGETWLPIQEDHL